MLLSRIPATFRRRRLDEEFDEEVRAHLDLLEERFIRRGMDADRGLLRGAAAVRRRDQVKQDLRERRASAANRRAGAGRPPRLSPAATIEAIHGLGRPDAGAGDRRHHRGLRGARHGRAPAAAVCGAGPTDGVPVARPARRAAAGACCPIPTSSISGKRTASSSTWSPIATRHSRSPILYRPSRWSARSCPGICFHCWGSNRNAGAVSGRKRNSLERTWPCSAMPCGSNRFGGDARILGKADPHQRHAVYGASEWLRRASSFRWTSPPSNCGSRCPRTPRLATSAAHGCWMPSAA